MFVYVCMLFFFFKQKTAYEMRISDWSSDVCSSDLDAADRARLTRAMESLKPRAKTLDEIADGAVFLFLPDALPLAEKAATLLRDAPAGLIADVTARLRGLNDWTGESVEAAVRENADAAGLRSEAGRVGTEWVRTVRSRW